MIEENRLGIFNENMVSDEEGEWTFIGQMRNHREQREQRREREGGIRKFRERLKDVSFEREGVQEGLRELAEKIRKAVTKKK